MKRPQVPDHFPNNNNPSNTTTMKTKYILTILCAAVTALAAPAFATEKSDEAKSDVKIPETLDALWTEIDAKHNALTAAVTAKDAKQVYERAEAVETLVNALPSKSADLPSDKLKRVQGQAKNIARVLDSLHEAATAGKHAEAEQKLKQVDSAMQILKEQYGK